MNEKRITRDQPIPNVDEKVETAVQVLTDIVGYVSHSPTYVCRCMANFTRCD